MKFLFVICAVVLGLAACGGRAAEDSVYVNVGMMRGPSALGLLHLMENAESSGNNYNFTIAGSPDEIVPLLVRGEIDIAAVPANLAAVLFNNPNLEISVISINTLGVLYIVDTSDSVDSVADLAGRSIAAFGQSATPEFVLNFVLRQNGLEPGQDVTINWHGSNEEIAAELAAGRANIAMFPEPFVTTVLMQNSAAQIALDVNEEWARVQPDYGMVMTATIARNAFIEAHPDALATFLTENSNSVEFVNGNPAAAADMAVYHGIIPNPNIAANAIPRSNLVFYTGDTMRNYLMGFLRVLYAANPASVGGTMPRQCCFFHTP
ncbi:MAG: PhnD/SsuA/transferrin family substrate-binding protein [Defluviitaleaceae bacterium]|nr:PhnD/SsuA/transferrin family substrate-binding protein [Defluviitaleaceae bacterium]